MNSSDLEKNNSFNVLDRRQSLRSHYLLEASAGTGKTYSIENIVVRLLIDVQEPCSLDEILIVTFTKAATQDLRLRIRKKLFTSLKSLQERDFSSSTPDYLVAILENSEALDFAEQQLEEALITFERAPIFTIHSFCHRMLSEHLFEADVGFSLSKDLEGIPSSTYYKLIKDFFRTQLHPSLISPWQLQRLIQHHRGLEKVEKEILALISKGISIAESVPFSSLQSTFNQQMILIKEQLNIQSEYILEDFMQLAPFYKEICNVQKKPKAENLEKINRFAQQLQQGHGDLNSLIQDGLYLVDAFHPENLRKNASPPSFDNLHYPCLIEILRESLYPVVAMARQPERILCTIASACKIFVETYLEKEEKIDFNGLLQSMHRAVQKQAFVDKIQHRFKVAIIDEFQDTDPIQWEIFKTLFLSKRLFLVGDPKQSIYGFRQADIYTYLDAERALSGGSRASLETNYRSTSPLIEGLNTLFGLAPDLIDLPKNKGYIPYLPVKWGMQKLPKAFTDTRGAIHFFTSSSKSLVEAEEMSFFPFISHEIQELMKQGIALEDCAILVADRFQASRLSQYFKETGLPFDSQHSHELSKTSTFSALQEFLQAILSPQESYLKAFLAGPLIGWRQQDLMALKTPFDLEPWIAKATELKKIWFKSGFSLFFQAFLEDFWSDSNLSVAESVLTREGGIDVYHQLQQLSEWLIQKENVENLSPHLLFKSLQALPQSEIEEEKNLKQRRDPEKSGVRILTIHSSKGLEYEIVFALGVVNRSRKPSLIVPQTTSIQIAKDQNDPLYQEYLLELDAEKMRQFYVALTRAKQRLYIPILFQNKPCEPGMSSPMELYLKRVFDKKCSSIDVDSYSVQNLFSKNKNVTFSEEAPPKKKAMVLSDFPLLQCPSKPKIAGTSRWIHSFTGLTAHKTISVLKEKPPSTTLPLGAEVGTLVHTLFEHLPFHLGKSPSECLEFVKNFTSHTAFAEWNSSLAAILFQTLTMPLSDSFQLAMLEENQCYREHPFLYSVQENYLKGIMDLIFYYDEKYYIVDWKSHWLGEDASCYNYENMKAAMHEHDYFLQASIYKEALKRYLALVDNRPFETIWGGTFYIFVRGPAFYKIV